MTHYSIRVRQGAPGDTVAVSPLVRDLSLLRPDTRISVRGTFADELFATDPRVCPIEPPQAVPIVVDYKPTVDDARLDHTQRYLAAAHRCFREQTGDALPLTTLKPSLVLGSDFWRPPDAGPYAVIAPGSKGDMPLKQHPPSLFSDVVRRCPEYTWVQVGKRTIPGSRMKHTQFDVPGTLNLVGQTSLRELMSVIAGATVVVCHTSLPMLLAQAFGVPAVVLGGGREDPWLHDAPGVTYLHTIGELACCLAWGCRASFPVRVNDAAYPPGTVCADPVKADGLWVGRCATMRTAAEIVNTVRAAVAGRLTLRTA